MSDEDRAREIVGGGSVIPEDGTCEEGRGREELTQLRKDLEGTEGSRGIWTRRR